jgi:hypothetical protein
MVTDRVQPTTEADTSGSDGKVSMEEAFTFALNTDPAATGALTPFLETPQHANINTPGQTTKFLATDGFSTPATIIVAVPNVVETWYAGFDRPISWTSRGVTNVQIQLYNSTNNDYKVLKSTITAATAKWTWPGIDNSNKYAGNAGTTKPYKIRINSTSSGGPEDMSDQYFYLISSGGTAGGLSVTSNIAGAKIYLDGADTTLTTVVGSKTISASASPGTHTIALVAPSGYLDQEKMITRTNNGNNYDASFTLAAIDTNAGYRDDDAGSMTITATPPEAHISINGDDKGTTLFSQKVIPGVDWEVYPHIYNVEVKADDRYIPASGVVAVGRGQTAYADFVLKGDPTWYKFTGFDAPIDMSTDSNLILNTVKAGSNIPIKWHLSDGKGYVSTQIFSLKIVDLKTCPNSLTDEIEVLDTSSPVSTLTYQGSGAWHYNWKTVKGTTGCKKVYLEYDNGLTSPAAVFKFR